MNLISATTGRPWLVGLLLAVVTFLVSAGISTARWPVPNVHDEFSYLLAADTFSAGRLTNLAHPHWQHFESFHIIQQPSYASKYPPGMGLFLAAGQYLTGEPIVGIWIASALSAAACYWMLLGWLPSKWAAVGGLLFITHSGFVIDWGQSYWGGTVAMLGGALVFGAVPRLGTKLHAIDSVAMAVGAVLLAVSRPYEGFVLCILAGFYVIATLLRQSGPTWKSIGWRLLLPQTLVFVVGGVALLNYHHSVTGSPTTFPYEIHESSYALSPNFLWQEPTKDHDYNHSVMARFHHTWALNCFLQQQTLFNWMRIKGDTSIQAVQFFFPLPLLIAVVLLMTQLKRGHRMVAVVEIAAACWMASMITVWSLPHYMAPMAAPLLLLSVWGLRYVKILGRKWLSTRRVAMALVLVQVVSFVPQVLSYINTPKDTWQWQRAGILQQLEDSPERHLVFVHYDPDHNPHHEWVYNRAAIDQAQVVWAREMGEAPDRALLDYFPDRKAWILKADAPQPHLQPITRKMNIAQMQL